VGNKLPKTRTEMRRAGYKFTGAAQCKSCHASIEWWITTNGRKMPYNPGGEHDPAVAHFVTCPNADQHRVARESKPASAQRQAPAAPMAGTHQARPAFERELKSLMDRAGARCAVLLYPDDAETITYKLLQDPEDLRNCLIATANHARDAVSRDRAAFEGGR
jgi:hypothetical protein